MSLSTSDQPLAIGIDFGGTTVKVAAIRGSEIVTRGNTITTGNYHGPGPLMDAMAVEVKNLQRLHPEAIGIGVGIPGWVNWKLGVVENLVNVKGWTKVPVSGELSARTGLTVVAENDATAMAYAEWKLGAAKGYDNSVCLTLGTGVGAGMILEGRLHRGAMMCAGEIGMMSVDMYGTKGPFGNDGFIEGYVGLSYLARRAQVLYAEAGQEKTLEDCDPRLLAVAAENGNEIAKRVWDEAGDRLGAMLADLNWALSLDCIVIGGGVAKAGDLIFGPTRKSIDGRCHPFITQNLKLVPAHFSNDAGMIGAALLAVHHAQGQPI
jgi:glucokinase